MRIKTILNKLTLIGKIFLVFSLFIFLIDNSYAEYFLVSDAPLAVCMSGCGSPHYRHRVRHHYKHKYSARRNYYRRSGYSLAVYYVWRDVPACGYVPSCGGCCNTYVPAAYTQTQFYDVYYRQPAYYRDYSDDGYYGDYNNDMRTGDDMAVGMDVDY